MSEAVVAARGDEDEGPRKVVLSADLLTGVPVVAGRKVEPATSGSHQLPKANAEQLGQKALECTCTSPQTLRISGHALRATQDFVFIEETSMWLQNRGLDISAGLHKCTRSHYIQPDQVGHLYGIQAMAVMSIYNVAWGLDRELPR